MRNFWRSVTMGGMTRLKQLALLNPGYKYKGDNNELARILYRLPELEVFSRYMENTQYDHLSDWKGDLIDQQNDDRKTKPKKIFPLPQIASDNFCDLLTSKESRLNFREEDTELQEKIDNFLKKIMLWPCVSSAFPSFYANGSIFIRFFKSPKDNKILLEPYNTKSCWPIFDENEDLDSVQIRYVYDTGDVDQHKKPIWRWAQYELQKNKDIIYDNPLYDAEKQTVPVFKVKETIPHALGFVQGVWIKNGINPAGDDGRSLIKDALGHLDDLNYLASKESNALFYSLYPTLLGFGVSEEDFTKTVSRMASPGSGDIGGGSSLITTERPPKDSDLRFLETSNTGLSLSDPYLQRALQALQQIMKIHLPNPEVLLGYAQSAEAMKMLYRPSSKEVERMRDFIEAGLCDMLSKIEEVAQKTDFAVPIGTFENCKKEWGDMFTATEADKAQRVSYTVQANESRILSRKTATAHLAPDFGIKNVEEELEQIESEDEMDREKELMDFKGQSDIEAQNNPKPAPAPAKKGKK